MVDVPQSGVPSGRATKGWIDGVLGGIFALRVPFVMGVITVAALTVPDQVREIHRILTQERTVLFFNWHWVFCLLALVALSLVLWQTSRQHAEEFLDDMPDDPPMHAAGRGLLVWGPRVLATLPLLGAALGIWLSRTTTVDLTEIEGDIPDALKGIVKLQNSLAAEFTLGAVVCLGLAVVVFVAAAMFERNLAPVGSRRARRVAVVNNWALFPLLILASIGLLIYSPVKLPQELGSIPIFALWMANLAVLFALFWRYSRIIGFPILAALIVVLVIFEVTGSTDNHRFRHAIPAKEIERPSIEEFLPRLDRLARRPRGVSERRQTLPALHRRRGGRRSLCRLPDGEAPRAHAGSLRQLRPARVRGEQRVGRQPGFGRILQPTQESAKNGAAVPCKTGPQNAHGLFERAAEVRPFPRSALARDLGNACSPTSCSGSFPDPFPETRSRLYAGARLRGYVDVSERNQEELPAGLVLRLCGAGGRLREGCDPGAGPQLDQYRDGHADGAQPDGVQHLAVRWAASPVRYVQQQRSAGRPASRARPSVERQIPVDFAAGLVHLRQRCDRARRSASAA